MKMSNFEVDFIKKLQKHVERNYFHMDFIVPLPVSYGPSLSAVPDVLLYNARTAEGLAIEIKGGSSLNSVPSALVSTLKAMKNFRLPSKDPINKVIVALVTSAFLPPSIKSMLEAEGIYCVTIETINEPIGPFEAILRKFDRGEI